MNDSPSDTPAQDRPEQIRIDPAALAFDIDGVVADTMHLFIEIAREEHCITDIRYEDIKCYMLGDCLDLDEEIIESVILKLLDGSYDRNLQPIEGAIPVLSRLAEVSAPLQFVTARPRQETIQVWMEKYLPVPPEQFDIVATGSFEAKTDVLLEKGVRFFVEDRIETCFQIYEAGITPILFRQPWNRQPHSFTEVAGWRELEAMIAF